MFLGSSVSRMNFILLFVISFRARMILAYTVADVYSGNMNEMDPDGSKDDFPKSLL